MTESSPRDDRDAAALRELRTELAEERALAADAMEYRVLLPEGGGQELLVKRQGPIHGSGWAVSVMRRGGGVSWTREGWQESISALSVDRLFCWPDARTAITEARVALTPDYVADPLDPATATPVAADVRELLAALGDVLDVPPGEDRDDIYDRATAGWAAIRAVLDQGSALDAVTRRLREKGAEFRVVDAEDVPPGS